MLDQELKAHIARLEKSSPASIDDLALVTPDRPRKRLVCKPASVLEFWSAQPLEGSFPTFGGQAYFRIRRYCSAALARWRACGSVIG